MRLAKKVGPLIGWDGENERFPRLKSRKADWETNDARTFRVEGHDGKEHSIQRTRKFNRTAHGGDFSCERFIRP